MLRKKGPIKGRQANGITPRFLIVHAEVAASSGRRGCAAGPQAVCRPGSLSAPLVRTPNSDPVHGGGRLGLGMGGTEGIRDQSDLGVLRKEEKVTVRKFQDRLPKRIQVGERVETE